MEGNLAILEGNFDWVSRKKGIFSSRVKLLFCFCFVLFLFVCLFFKNKEYSGCKQFYKKSFVETDKDERNFILARRKKLKESWGGTQLWVGYGCVARSFNHPITKPEKMQICNLCLNHLLLEGPFFKPISAFYHVNWDA